MIQDKPNRQGGGLHSVAFERAEKPLSRGRRFWLTVILLPAVLPPLGFIAWFAYNSAHLADRYTEGKGFIADVHVIEDAFRAHVAGRQNYPAFTMDDLSSEGATSKAAVEAIRSHHGHLDPFSSSTPDTTVVLTLRENWLSTWDFTKADLVKTPKAAVPSPTSAFGF